MAGRDTGRCVTGGPDGGPGLGDCAPSREAPRAMPTAANHRHDDGAFALPPNLENHYFLCTALNLF
jgi:hypothetical protein